MHSEGLDVKRSTLFSEALVEIYRSHFKFLKKEREKEEGTPDFQEIQGTGIYFDFPGIPGDVRTL